MTERLEMVVLRAPGRIRAGSGSLPFGSEEATVAFPEAEAAVEAPSGEIGFTELSISREDPTMSELRDLDRDEEVIGVAPAMPVVLIAPMDAPSAEPAAAPPISWGIEAVGAASAGTNAGSGVVVAVLDTGIDRNHPAFVGVDIVARNFTSEAAGDTHGHGTHCAGTIFGRDVNGSRIGVARGVGKALIGKVLGRGGGSTETVYRAMQWAMSEGAHIISMSLGMDFPGFQSDLVRRGFNPVQATSIALAGYRANVRLFDAISRMVTVPDGVVGGTVVVAAAGNESERPNFAVTVAPPAAGEQFMAVAALDRSNDPARPFSVARFSNDEANVAGPGVGIWSARAGGGLVAFSGTSMATPHVAGVAALWAEQPVASGSFRARHIIQSMLNSADRMAYLPARDIGQGMPRAP